MAFLWPKFKCEKSVLLKIDRYCAERGRRRWSVVQQALQEFVKNHGLKRATQKSINVGHNLSLLDVNDIRRMPTFRKLVEERYRSEYPNAVMPGGLRRKLNPGAFPPPKPPKKVKPPRVINRFRYRPNPDTEITCMGRGRNSKSK